MRSEERSQAAVNDKEEEDYDDDDDACLLLLIESNCRGIRWRRLRFAMGTAK
jgi:hypothetical protein